MSTPPSCCINRACPKPSSTIASSRLSSSYLLQTSSTQRVVGLSPHSLSLPSQPQRPTCHSRSILPLPLRMAQTSPWLLYDRDVSAHAQNDPLALFAVFVTTAPHLCHFRHALGCSGRCCLYTSPWHSALTLLHRGVGRVTEDRHKCSRYVDDGLFGSWAIADRPFMCLTEVLLHLK